MSFIEPVWGHLGESVWGDREGAVPDVQSDLAALGLALELSDEHLTCLRTLG